MKGKLVVNSLIQNSLIMYIHFMIGMEGLTRYFG